LASAKAFAQSGASLFISARSTDVLARVKKEIEEEFKVPVAYHTVDISKEESVREAVEACVKEYGKIDIVISNGKDSNSIIGANTYLCTFSWWR